MITITNTIEIVWLINGIKNYGFGKDNNLYNLKTGRKLKQCLNNSCIGYWFGKKFYSLNKLKPLLYKPKKQKQPF